LIADETLRAKKVAHGFAEESSALCHEPVSQLLRTFLLTYKSENLKSFLEEIEIHKKTLDGFLMKTGF
jgi:hypothetical protein